MEGRHHFLCLLLPAFLAGAALAVETNAPIVFPPAPRVLMSAAELAAFKSDPAREGERKNVLANADKLLEKGLNVPVKEGNWIFYYACPTDNADLRAETPERHVCPVCKKVFDDERTAASYRTKLYNELEGHLKTLATAYALSGDVKYAAPVRETLLSLAKTWPTLTRHDRWGRTGLLAVVGGRRFCQLLDEAVSLINLAGVWDLAASAPCFTADDRALIEKQLFRMPALELATFEAFAGSRNNHQTWFNAAYAMTGLALGDEALLRRAVDGPAGLRWQLANSITADGLWYEGALAYHFYALQAIMKTLEACRTAGLDFSTDARLKSLWLGPLQLAYPNGQCPVFHDSDPSSLSSRKSVFEWGARYFKDPALASGDPSSLGSTNLAGIGVAVLRRGTGDGATCVMLDYGLHGDSHGHPDKLNIVLYGLGRELMPDPGRISYSVPEYKSWCRTTVAHNTVILDGRDQEPDCGRLPFFADTAEAAGCLAVSDGAYPRASLRRFLVLVDTLLVDVFSVARTQTGTLDWLLHGRGDLADLPGLQPCTTPLQESNGYGHLANLKEGRPPGTPAVTFSFGTATCWRVWLPGADAGEQWVTGTGIGYQVRDTVPFVMRRRTGASTTFAAVYDLSGSASITNVTLVAVEEKAGAGPAAGTIGLRIESADQSRLVALDFSDEGSRKLLIQGKTFNRWLISQTKHCE